jgi:hypothetical protein
MAEKFAPLSTGDVPLSGVGPEADNPALIRTLVGAGAEIQFVGEIRHSLEDVYLKLIDEAA